MTYTEGTVLELAPEHEAAVFDDDSIDIADEGVTVRLEQRVKAPNSPLTHWEVYYIDETPNHTVGDTRIISRETISNNDLGPAGSSKAEDWASGDKEHNVFPY